jgi:glutaredoxin
MGRFRHRAGPLDSKARRGVLLGDAPRLTASIRIALVDLGLNRVVVFYPGSKRFSIADHVEAIPFLTLATNESIFVERASLASTILLPDRIDAPCPDGYCLRVREQMKGTIPFAAAIIVTLVLASCASAPSSSAGPRAEGQPITADVIIIYGRPTCPNCQALRASLDAANIAYRDMNIDEDQAMNQEMWDKISSVTENTDDILLPVVDVNGTILVNNPTSLEELKPYLKKK